ncbi:response regulator transcription factor [Paenibacillus sp. GP183]|uniref:response regulator transcription factor n=1 Tax=Paenibacillus sp. GP183 TaxID=1882751 RepID=UPI00089D6EAA|nr:response regulator transcription factor [Paenibacillus sp. GP183]SEB91065.1 Response regulator receiver domain-containing protein [Paenibacillus sp. GP183]
MLPHISKGAADSLRLSILINKAMMESNQPAFGLLLVECSLTEEQLKELDAVLEQMDLNLQKSIVFELERGLLSILLPDQKLHATHYVSLQVKQFLQEEQLLGGNILIANFSGFAMPADSDIEAMIGMLREEVDRENTILIYNPQEVKNNKSTILIIDEDEAVGELLDSQLRMKGFQVYKASSGEEGLRLFDILLPDLVITELSLPVFDGFEVIRSIRKKMNTECHIMVLSDNQMEKDISICFEMGVSDYIKKPYSPVELEARVRRLLE